MTEPAGPTVCFIVGLAGSGKTHLARKMAWDRHFDEDFARDPEQQRELIRLLREGKKCTICEAMLVSAEYRSHVVSWLRRLVPAASVLWICFENDLETANWNCMHRTNKGDAAGHVRINGSLHPNYTYAEGAEIRPIFRLPA